MATRRTSLEWSRLLTRYGKSGESQAAFCERHGISLTTLQYHLKKDRFRQSCEVVPAGFIELSSSSTNSKVELELSLPSGAVLRLRG